MKAKYPHAHIPDPGFNLTGQKCYICFQHNQKFRMRVRSAKSEVLSCQKTAKIDSEVIAKLALNDMVQPSRVFPKTHREYRSYIRLRHKLVQKRTDIKNAHEILRITCPNNESPFHLPFLYINSIIPLGQEGCLLFGSSKPSKN